MARFYARFDHGTVGTLDSDLYDRRVINSQTSSAAAAGYNSSYPDIRGGLITSRSALSDAMKAELDATNEDGQLGPYIAPSNAAGTVPNITRNGGNLQWNYVYKPIGSTLPGIKIPANFATRPTSSVYTDDGNLIDPPDADGGTISDSLYVAASTAVLDTLNTIKKVEGSLPYSTDGSPYVRLGQVESRTLHSVFHNASLDYFAWDDFTPGEMSTSGMGLTAPNSKCNGTNNVTNIQFTWHSVLSYQFKNDGNGSAKIGIQIRLTPNGPSGTCTTTFTNNYRLQLGYSTNDHGGPLTLGTSTSGNGPVNPSTSVSGCAGTSGWTWNGFGGYNSGGTPNLTWNVKLPDCASPGYNIEVSVRLFDATITTNSTGVPGIISADLTVSL